MNRLCDIAINCEDTTDPVAGLSSQAVSPAAGRCLGLDCPGDLFGNLSVECGDVDYLADTFRCFCVGDPLDIRFRAPGIGPFTWTIGDLPDGIVALPDFYCPEVLHIFGTFTMPGRDQVPISVKDGFGNITTVTLTLSVLLIVTGTLPESTVGVPYSLQLIAIGGSGSYAWKILSGALAPGLALDMNGLISGTPTGIQPETVTFRVTDRECETIDPSYSPPYCELSGMSNISTRTWLGFNAFIATDPAKRYKKLTWEGTVDGSGVGWYGRGFSAVLGYCGATEIDSDGNVITTRQENGYSSCHADVFGNCLSAGGVPLFLGGCLHGSVLAGTLYSANYGLPTTPIDWKQRNAVTGYRDIVWGILGESGYSSIVSGTVAEKKTTANGAPLYITHNDRTVTLSDEYTDVEATARAVNTTAPGLTAAYISRHADYYDRRISVDFQVACHNLMPGQSYQVEVTFWNSNGTFTTGTYNFTATTTDYTVTDTIPVPPQDTYITVLNPIIQSV